MKKIIVIVLTICLLCGLIGCTTKSIEKNIETAIEKSGFILIDLFGERGDVDIFLVYDPNTKVEYLFTRGPYSSMSICPYYDSNGNIAIYKGGD